MEAIKKRLAAYQTDLDAALDKVAESELKIKEHRERADRAELELTTLNRRIQFLEEDLERSEERLKLATQKLAEVTHVADESERIRKALEHRAQADDEKIETLEKSFREAKALVEESERKYEDIGRKLDVAEAEFDRVENRALVAEKKNAELEEELQIIGNNLRSLEIKEEKYITNEQALDKALRAAQECIKQAESRAEAADQLVQKLQSQVDILEEALVDERGRYKHISDELDQTYSELTAL